MFRFLSKKLTNNYEEVPLFLVLFNLEKYLNEGEKGSCDVRLHPSLKDDEEVKEKLNNLIDYIRANYDMDKLSK